MDITKIQVPDGTTATLRCAQNDLRSAEERLSRACVENRIPHGTELRVAIYAAMAASAQASRQLAYALSMSEDQVY